MLRQLGADLVLICMFMSTVMSTKKQHRNFSAVRGVDSFERKLPGEGSNTAQKQPQRSSFSGL